MRYWIVENEERIGPMSAEELLARNVTDETLVWHEGLTDWTPLGLIDELSSKLEAAKSAQNIANQDGSMPQQRATATEFPVANTTKEENRPPCPPSNLVWAVISLLCCCFPLSVIAIIYGSQVSTKYNLGDYEGAKKASERAAWWTILSIVIGLVAQPFVMLFQMIGAA